MIEPSEQSLQTLAANGVPRSVIDAAVRMTECLRLAGDDVADSTSDEDLFDDPTSRGQLLYRRARNRMIAEFEGEATIRTSTTDNAFHVHVAGTAISFYSATHGLDQPALGGSRNKKSVVTEMQAQLDGLGVEQPKRLVLMHATDEEGLLEAALGVLQAGTDWVWRAKLYDRIAPINATGTTEAGRSYEEQEEAALPPIRRREEPATGTSSES